MESDAGEREITTMPSANKGAASRLYRDIERLSAGDRDAAAR